LRWRNDPVRRKSDASIADEKISPQSVHQLPVAPEHLQQASTRSLNRDEGREQSRPFLFRGSQPA